MEQPSGLTIADIFFPCSINTRKKNATQKDSDFVYKKGSSPYSNLQQLVLAAACRRPVLLKGPVGSGKTSTVEYFARATGHKSPNSNDDLRNTSLFIKVQLGEQTDSRMLLGGYQCTEIPGQFIWKPGVLTQAVMKGYWLLLEDIDCSSSDVITIIENLIKTQTLFIPGYGESIILHPQFQLFATQRTLGHESTSCMRSNVLKQWITIYLSPLSNSEIVDIVTEKYPRLKTVAEKMVSVLDVDFTSYSISNRLPSVRDILKWCNRSQSYFETGSPESALKIFQDAVDIFCGFMEKGLQFTVATQIGLKLGIVQNKANFISSTYKPNIVVSNKDLLAGRASLQRQKDSVTLINRAKNYVFSLTKQSCCLIEKISCCLQNNESVLLVGETGCGKTTVLQYIADVLGRTLVVINMNQQSDAADLLGGYKPVTFKWVMKPFCEKFEILFRDLFNPKKNADCLNKFSKLLKKENWDVLLGFIAHVQKRALTQITTKLDGFKAGGKTGRDKEEVTKWKNRLTEWTDLSRGIEKYSKQREAAQKSLVFSYVEGSLVTAMRKGHWVLLDEINLATSETLDCLSGLLENSRESITLLEKGDNCPIYRDSGFRLFAAMNPATDVGKKQLPIGLRNRFTELFIDELDDVNDLRPLIETYLCELNQSPTRLKKIANFYLKVKKRLKNQILDGCGRKPHFSLRNLCRALQITAKNPCGTFARSLYESLSVSFLTQLDSKSYKMVLDLITETVTESDIKSVLNQPIPKPEVGEHVNLEGFWLPVGSLEPSVPDNYILTPTVRRHLRDLIKIVSLATGVPVLLEGDTSVGKTSLINYLAKCTGNVCSRVNNHEHTDIQEYIGTYVADCNGKLVFKEGILCECMRKGHWLILDELNLAPTEVLEALNRVLDDNRELFIPETQTTIRAHDRFLLFATQNPPGLYGGRKELSRAFRNRFVELQFNQIPPAELVTILEKRCQLPLNYCKKMVGVMTDLQLMRRGSDIFVGKAGFITLRDLFRWGERYHKARVEAKFHDWEQHLGDEGYILLAGRVRLLEESKVIEEVIAKHFKRRPDPNNLFCLHENTSAVSRNILESLINQSRCEKEFSHIVWTYSMRRLAVLVCKALDFSEPVLIVGETGCGKTSVVQMLAKMKNRDLYSVNCHMHSESTDFLGGLRPVRDESRTTGKLFEWCDGPLVKAMTSGSFFLADEISLADDSVLERLNSLLEPERTILLAEKGGGLIEDENEEYTTVAQENFQFIGTMNPGGDYGKKELSPALRNRFTEIWADSTFNKYESYCEIIRHNLILSSKLCSSLPEIMTGFLRWFQSTEIGKRVTLSTRDILTWVTFMNLSDLPWHESCIHGVCLTFLDGLGSGSRMVVSQNEIKNFKEECLEYLVKQINLQIPEKAGELSGMTGGGGEFLVEKTRVGIHPFYIRRGENATSESSYVFNAPTTLSNAKRILRSLKMNKAILLEGSPGVGKTSLITSLAKICGYKVTRINLSDQTDISDLLGADLPEEGGSAGHFVWRDGPFMTALKEGQWILLDELNLASQSVLEGLNAILDHRGSVYIPELNKVFHVSTKTRIFGCQNPLKEGGNRRGLPSSFLNRFTQVYLDSLTQSDYGVILKETFPALSTLRLNGEPITWLMIKFTSEMCQGVLDGRLTGPGGPWEFNLRDITRWAEGIMKDLNLGDADSLKSVQSIEGGKLLLRVAFKHMNLLYLNRFRSKTDRNMVYDIFTTFFGENDFGEEKPQIYITEDILVIGENVSNVNKSFFYGDLNEFEIFTIEKKPRGSKVKNNLKNEIRKTCAEYYGKRKLNDLRLLEQQYPILSSLCHCVNMNWLAILVGQSGTGKTSCIRTLAALKGENLRILACNSTMETTEILGGFEQTDYNRHLEALADSARVILLSAARRYMETGKEDTVLALLQQWVAYMQLGLESDSVSASAALNVFKTKINFLRTALRRKDVQKYEDLRSLAKTSLDQLEHLQGSLSAADCLTFGGKFEWVDSVLVKSLKDGSWLVVEDVNLCSNAVLDRLNGLLEPNGCLTIGERGSDAEGKIPTIMPHPNFRLFFTMDPTKGTISRAMRNRGVEIFLPDSDDIASSWPKLDLIPLLHDAGIEDFEVQKALLETESHSVRHNISNLVLNAFWTAQYLKQKFPKSEAFKLSSYQIYKFMDGVKEEFIEELSQVLAGRPDRSIDVSLLRPTINLYIVDPTFARLKQTCAFLHAATEIVKKGVNPSSQIPPDICEYFFGSINCLPNSCKVSLLDLGMLNILHVYLTISGDIVGYLKEFIATLLSDVKELKWKTLVTSLTERLANILDRTDMSSYPWDQRWFENVWRFFGYQSKINPNNSLLLMRYSFDGRCTGDDYFPAGVTTVEKYSKSVQGRAENSFPDHLIVPQFNTYLEEFDKLLTDILTSSCVQVSDEEARRFLNLMKWRFRLGRQGQLVLFTGNNEKKLNEDTLTLLEMHFAWFINSSPFQDGKTSFSLSDNLPTDMGQRISKFCRNSENMIPSKSAILIRICNALRKHLGHSPPNKFIPLAESTEGGNSSPMEVDVTPNSSVDFRGDRHILRGVLNTLVEYFNSRLMEFIEQDNINDPTFEKHLMQFFTLLRQFEEEMKSSKELKNLVQDFIRAPPKEKAKLVTEMLHCSLKILTQDFAFEEELNESSQLMYLRQILPYHRPVWTSRILNFVFGDHNAWSLSNYQNARIDLRNLKLTILPNVPQLKNKETKTSLTNSRVNELSRLKFEFCRVLEGVKKTLGLVPTSQSKVLLEVIGNRLQKTRSGVEKLFYRRIQKIINVLLNIEVNDETRHDTLGLCWVLLGSLELVYLTEGKSDPIRKKLIKAEYARGEVADIQLELCALECHSAITGVSLNHLYYKYLKDTLNEAQGKLVKYVHLEKVKRHPSSFRELIKEMSSFMAGFDDVVLFCEMALEKVFQCDQVHDSISVQYLYRKGRFLVLKVKSFINNVEKYKIHFGDIAYPILAATSQVELGLNLILTEIMRTPFCRYPELERTISGMCQFPLKPGSHLISQFMNLNSAAWPCDALKKMNENKSLVLFSSYLAKINEWLYIKKSNQFEEIIGMFSLIVEYWKKEDEKKRKEAADKESLYVKKEQSKCENLSEEEEFLKEMTEVFPTFEEDFSENQSDVKKETNVVGSLSDEHLIQVSRLHMRIIKNYRKVCWSPRTQTNISPDLVSPLAMRFSLLHKVLPSISYLLTRDTDNSLLPGLLVLLRAKETGFLFSEAALLPETGSSYNFYHDRNIDEVVKCLHILDDLKVKLASLLMEWPDHPTLLEMNSVITRISMFSIDSPVMRFLTGLEILLKTCQDWESVAHSGVSIADHLVKLTNLIIEWRKLELQGWMNCLYAAHERIKRGTFKWWFHFWCLVEEYLGKDDSETKTFLDDVLKCVYNFMELSPAGEYSSRLDILVSFHYHVLHLPQSKRRDELTIALWNLYSFYRQFEEEVAQKLSQDTTQISKKLKEFVKIARWHDITYWSVKQAIEKSHRTLFKYVKEYEVFLKERVDLKSLEPRRGNDDRCQKKSKRKKSDNHSKINFKCWHLDANIAKEEDLISLKNLDKKLKKAEKFSCDIAKMSGYEDLISELDNLTGDICQSTEHFAKLDVDRTLPKEKQKSQAKNIVHQKRRALADLFKTLQLLGLSYRTGLSDNQFGVLEMCTAPPLNQSGESDGHTLTGEDYYLKSNLRRLVLENSLLSPSKEIGPQVIERLRGYTGHIMDLNRKLRNTLNEAENSFVSLKIFENTLISMTKVPEREFYIPNQNRFSKVVDALQVSLGKAHYIVEQFKCVLDSWPATGTPEMKMSNYLSSNLTPTIFTSAKSDVSYMAARSNFDDISSSLANLKRQFDRKLIKESGYYVTGQNGNNVVSHGRLVFYTMEDVTTYDECISEYKTIMARLVEFARVFDDETESVCHGLLDWLPELQESCKLCNTYILTDNTSLEERTQLRTVLSRQVEELVQGILLAVQHLTKSRENMKDKEKQDNTENKADQTTIHKDNYLTKHLISRLGLDFSSLNTNGICQILSNMFLHLTSFSGSNDLTNCTADIFRLLSIGLSFVVGYKNLILYFLTQQRHCYRASNKLSSVLIGTFIQVAQKGYCAPPEYEEDEGDGDSGWNDKEGGGFTGGDGDGQKDVSNRIESEDQLEDAKPKGSEKDDAAEKDCKEEKDGIEMSENFDGKAQDIEKPEDDEEGNESENDEKEEDDADMEMGETEPGADKLESEMWSDSEDDEEDNTEKREDSGGKGEEAEQDKYAPKNDGEDENDQSDENSGGDKEKKQKKKDINEMDDAEDNGDQIDPYHGNHPPEQEPEPLDLPDDMQLDDGEAKGEDAQEENPFDIDAMKQQQPPMEADEEQENERKTNEEDKIDKDSDSDENDNKEEHTEPMEVDEEEGDDEESGESDDDGTTKRSGGDEKNEEKMEEEVTQNDDFRPSDDKPSEMAAQAAPDTNIEETMSRDQVVGGDDTKPNEFQPQETSQKTDMEPKGVGQAEIEGTKQGHDAAASKKEKLKSGQAQEKRERKRERPGKSDDDRCLGDAESTVNKKLKTLDRMEEKEMETQTGAENENESEIYQHISEKVKDAVQVLDAATKEQAESQCVPKGEDEEEESGNEEDLAMDVDVEESMNVEKTNEQKPTEVEGKKSQNGNKENEGGDPVVEEVKYETSGEVVETVTVSRGPETTFHTQLSALKEEKGISLQPEEVEALRREIQEQLQLHKQSGTPAKSIQAWQLLTSVTDGLARDLSEQLRVILEPTRATRLKGDYRTGRRINMRKVISYIASEFRKDNIWLRRTKPWKREYEIVLAIDDSHSMFHNESRELAFESLALVSKALDLIEAGRLGVLSFGEKTNIVHRLGDPFSEDVGARVINEFTFVQNKTLLCEMLDVSTTMMTSEKKSDAAQLLLIISDGRGVFSEGLERVKEAVRRATDSGIFLVFIIIDNPTSKDSIMDIRMPEFNDGKFVSMKSYMEQFPFPYYLILRDITQLPSTLSGALRQWFQLITCDRTDRW